MVPRPPRLDRTLPWLGRHAALIDGLLAAAGLTGTLQRADAYQNLAAVLGGGAHQGVR